MNLIDWSLCFSPRSSVRQYNEKLSRPESSPRLWIRQHRGLDCLSVQGSRRFGPSSRCFRFYEHIPGINSDINIVQMSKNRNDGRTIRDSARSLDYIAKPRILTPNRNCREQSGRARGSCAVLLWRDSPCLLWCRTSSNSPILRRTWRKLYRIVSGCF